jgi:hypothetical protein
MHPSVSNRNVLVCAVLLLAVLMLAVRRSAFVRQSTAGIIRRGRGSARRTDVPRSSAP